MYDEKLLESVDHFSATFEAPARNESFNSDISGTWLDGR